MFDPARLTTYIAMPGADKGQNGGGVLALHSLASRQVYGGDGKLRVLGQVKFRVPITYPRGATELAAVCLNP